MGNAEAVVKPHVQEFKAKLLPELLTQFERSLKTRHVAAKRRDVGILYNEVRAEVYKQSSVWEELSIASGLEAMSLLVDEVGQRIIAKLDLFSAFQDHDSFVPKLLDDLKKEFELNLSPFLKETVLLELELLTPLGKEDAQSLGPEEEVVSKSAKLPELYHKILNGQEWRAELYRRKRAARRKARQNKKQPARKNNCRKKRKKTQQGLISDLVDKNLNLSRQLRLEQEKHIKEMEEQGRVLTSERMRLAAQVHKLTKHQDSMQKELQRTNQLLQLICSRLAETGMTALMGGADIELESGAKRLPARSPNAG